MENASKALIIAGAILISIVLISLGMLVLNQADEIVSGSGMTQAEVQSFNSKFLKYEGKQKGSAIRSMVQEVMANNNSGEASDETRISINVANGATAITAADVDAANTVTLEPDADKSPAFKANFKNTKTYTVTFVYKNGRIAIIQVK